MKKLQKYRCNACGNEFYCYRELEQIAEGLTIGCNVPVICPFQALRGQRGCQKMGISFVIHKRKTKSSIVLS